MSGHQKIIANLPVDFVSTEQDLINYFQNKRDLHEKGIVIYDLSATLQILFGITNGKIAGHDFKHRRSLPVELKKHLAIAGEVVDIDQQWRHNLGMFPFSGYAAELPSLALDVAVKKMAAFIQMTPEHSLSEANTTPHHPHSL